MTSHYTQRVEHCSALIRRASSCSRQELTLRPTTEQCTYSERFGPLSLKGDDLVKPLQSRLKGAYVGKEAERS